MRDNEELYRKLMLHKFDRKLMWNQPEDFHDLDGIPFDAEILRDSYDLIISFVLNLDEMEKTVMEAASRGLVAEGGYLYLAYPKKGNKKYKEFIDRDSIFPHFGIDEADGFVRGTSLKFSKMVSLNDTFTIVGLKCMLWKPSLKSGNRPSHCVDDYIEKVPKLRSQLENRPEVLSIYDSLTFGYQKDWARHVYSAQTEEVRERRILEMGDIILAGYKSINLFRQANRQG